MSITLDDIKACQYEGLNTLSSKVIYLMIENRANEEGWAAISYRELAMSTGLTDIGVKQVVKKLLAHGLIEKNSVKEHANQTNQYRTLK